VRRLAPLALAVLLVSGCGRSNKPFTVAGTSKCLQGAHFRVSTKAKDIGFVATSAPNGALRAFTSGSANVTVSFSDDALGAANQIRAYRRFASKQYRRRMRDILFSRRNAVLLWSIAPTPEQLNTAMNCLRP
jgi:hypothetical protein